MKQPRPVLAVTAFCLIAGAMWAAFLRPTFDGRRETAPKNTCINNLRVIDGAKQTWAQEHQKSGGDVPTWAELKPYLTRGADSDADSTLKCPKGGTYTLGAVTSAPTCSIPGHALPQ